MRNSCRFAMAVHVLTVMGWKGQRVTSHLLASSVNTNPVVVRRLLSALQKAKLVETRKGLGLGSRLAREPQSIDLAQVYQAVEEEFGFNLPPRKPNRACPVGNCIQDSLHRVFAGAEGALVECLKNTTLADLLGDVKRCASERGIRK